MYSCDCDSFHPAYMAVKLTKKLIHILNGKPNMQS